MTRFLRSWLRALAGTLHAHRQSFVPAVLLLEDRTLPSVQFTPAPYAVPAHRPDTPLTPISLLHPVEPYLSVNPADPGDIAVSSDNGIRVSTTAGGSFTGATPWWASTGGDTSTTYDSAGRLFWVNLTSPGGLSGISIAQVDPATGGIVNQHVVDQVPDNSFSDDKGFIAADPSNNNLYVIWTRFGPGGDNSTHLLMRHSSNQGVSWSDPVQVDNGSDNFVWPATVTVAPDHMVYAAYHSVRNAVNGQGDVPDHDGKVVVVRYDNDLTHPLRSIAELSGRADITFNVQTFGFARKIPGAQFWIQGGAQPWVLADPVRPGHIYVISADANNGFHQDYGDIRLARSTDYGMHWSSSLIATSSALFPNAAIDQFGDIVVAWYDNRRGLANGAGHFKLDVYATYSTDGGLTFAPAFPVNDQTPGVNTPNGNIFDPDPGAVNRFASPPPTTRIGEYFGIGIWGGTAYVAWNGNTFAGFNNPNGQQVWMKAFAIRGSLSVTGTDGNDDIIVRSIAGNPDFVEVVVNGQRQYAGLWSALTGISVNAGPGDDQVQIDDTVAGTPVTVSLGNGNDTVNVGGPSGDLGTVQSPVAIHGGSGSDGLAIVDQNNAADTSFTITDSSVSRLGSATISYDNIALLVVWGGAGNNAYNVLGTLRGQVIIVPGFGFNPGSNTLNIDDRSNTANTTYTVTNSSIARTGSGTISYSTVAGNITDLVINGGSGDNTYNVVSTRSLYPTRLNTGNGTDTVNVRGSAGPLFINGGSGGDMITLSNTAGTLGGMSHVIVNDLSNSAAVTVDDSGFAGSTTYTITNTQVAAAAWPNFLLVYNNLASLNLNGSTGDDRFTIESTASPTSTTITAGSGSNRFDLTPTAQYLAEIAGPLNLSGSGADTLVFWDTANPNAETYTFDDIPSMLALATVPTFATSWSGMGSVYLETNGMSTVNDPSGTVLVDVPPPGSPDTLQGPPVTTSAAAERTIVQALLDAAPKRNAALPGASMVSDSLVADVTGHRARKSQGRLDLPDWEVLGC
jgi:hypothetical protein